MVFVERGAGVVVGIYQNRQPGRAEEALADDHADVQAFRAADPRLTMLPLAVLQSRIEAENSWDTYVNHMFGAPARRNAFLRIMMIGHPVRIDSAPLRTSLEGAGLTAEQIGRILAPIPEVMAAQR